MTLANIATGSILSFWFLASGLLTAAPLCAQGEAQPSIEERLSTVEKKLGTSTPDTPMQVFWKDGLRFESADSRYKVKLGGRIMYDGAFLDADSATRAAVEGPLTKIEDGTEFRRARIELSGEVPERIEWKAAFDFAADKASFRDVYVGMKGLPVGNLRVGQMKEPFGLEQLTSSKDITFLERSSANSADPARNAGFMLFDTVANERMTWAAGAFRAGSDAGEISKGDGEWAETARVTGLPHMSEDGRSYVHLGLSATHRSSPMDIASFSAKPESNIAPSYISFLEASDSVVVLRPELAWTQGPCSLQGEYTLATIDTPSGGSDPDFTAWYAQLSWFLTGEHRPYKKKNGAIGPVKPGQNAFGEGEGWGAWELAARYSNLDFTDTDDGELNDVTLGVNWYLNPNVRVMLNYILAQLDPSAGGAEGDTHILQFRFQFAY